jgi:hypothetical protein
LENLLLVSVTVTVKAAYGTGGAGAFAGNTAVGCSLLLMRTFYLLV